MSYIQYILAVLSRYIKARDFTLDVLVDLFGVLHLLQHHTGQISKGGFVGRGNQYIQLVKVLYCELPTIDKQQPTFEHQVRGLNC